MKNKIKTPEDFGRALESIKCTGPLTKKKKLTKKQISRIKLWWELLQLIDADCWKKAMLIEKRMRLDPVIGIKDIEFYWNDGWAGVGNESRTMALIPEIILNEEK